jgi:hypothetical protein
MRWIQSSFILLIVFLVISIMLVWSSSIMYLKFLVILVYIRGVVVFILYISCICWFVRNRFNYRIVLFFIFLIIFFDSGVYSKFSDVGEFLWIFIFFAFLFNRLVSNYSLNLYKNSGSLRF